MARYFATCGRGLSVSVKAVSNHLCLKSVEIVPITLAMAFFVVIFGGRASAGSAAVVKLKGNHPSNLARLGPMVHADPAMRLHLTVVLAVHDQAKLDQLLADQQNPSSSQYHRWLTPAQFNQRFGPTRAQTNAVVRWLEREGLRVDSING